MQSTKHKIGQNGIAAIAIILGIVLVLTLAGLATWYYFHNVKSEVKTDIQVGVEDSESVFCGNKACDADETSENCPQDCRSNGIYCVKTGDSCPTAGNTCCDGYCDKNKNTCVACPPNPAIITCPAGYVMTSNVDSNGCITGNSCVKQMCTQKGNNCCRNYTDCGASASCDLDSVVDMKGCDSDCKPIFECVESTGCVKEYERTGLNSRRDCCDGLIKQTEYQESPDCSMLAGDCKPSPAIDYVCVRRSN